MCENEDPFFSNTMELPLFRGKVHPRIMESHSLEYIGVAIGSIITSLIVWAMGYTTGLSVGESRAYKTLVEQKVLVIPSEPVTVSKEEQ